MRCRSAYTQVCASRHQHFISVNLPYIQALSELNGGVTDEHMERREESLPLKVLMKYMHIQQKVSLITLC